ncbi:MAG: hypothetical protein JW742_09270, partial [Candidatus Aminicenantes bacterium]|nr:hypothetical protein [Candidatus Aminicenantes bacterium]
MESYVEAELLCLEETYRILDRFSEELWPGWRNYAEVPVEVDFPDGVVLLVSSRGKVGRGFERVAGRSICGKAVYVNRKKRTAVEVRPPLFAGRARGGKLIKVEMGQPDLPAAETERAAALESLLKEKSRPESPFDLAPLGDTDSRILSYIHEHFHGYRVKFPANDLAVAAVPLFRIDAEYAAWSQVEGLALQRTYDEPEDAAAREFLKDFLVAREIKRALMPREAANFEALFSAMEGTSSYVSLKAAMLLGASDYEPALDRTKNPYFYAFAYVDGYIDNIMRKGMDYAVSLTRDTQRKYYFYGVYQCFLLDRFAPGWKRGFLEEAKTLDEVMAGL